MEWSAELEAGKLTTTLVWNGVLLPFLYSHSYLLCQKHRFGDRIDGMVLPFRSHWTNDLAEPLGSRSTRSAAAKVA